MSKGRILIVDDEPSGRTVLVNLLRQEGYELETAGDGFKAMTRLQEWSADLVLTALDMPGMDGVELLRQVKAGDPERPVVLLTAAGGVETAVSALREGAADYLTKPLDTGELLIVLERCIEHAKLRREASDLRQFALASRRDAAPPIPGSTLDALERYAILKTMESVGGSTTKAADILGVSVRKIQYKLQEYSAGRKSKNAELACLEATERVSPDERSTRN